MILCQALQTGYHIPRQGRSPVMECSNLPVGHMHIDIGLLSSPQGCGGMLPGFLTQFQPVIKQDQIGRVLSTLRHHSNKGFLLLVP